MTARAHEDAWFKHMNLLRRHMVKCGKCKGALQASFPDHLCITGSVLVVKAAWEFNSILDIKKAATSALGGAVYACPDIAMHGPAAALAAQPLRVIGIQEGLF